MCLCGRTCAPALLRRKHNSADLFPAKVLAIGHMCDLALLTVDDDRFWEGLRPLHLSGIPQLYQDVMVRGTRPRVACVACACARVRVRAS